ncbi:MAG: hypothetical protein Q4A65_06100 [Bacillota bacterium]|nr:hypothetical protein [Bacillota bacterium]
MKKILTILISGIMLMFISACGDGPSGDVAAGEWEVSFSQEAELPDDAQVAFDKFMGDYDGDLAPVAYIGKQLVAGTNYALICYDKQNDMLKSVCIYEDLSGETPETTVKDLDFSSLTEDRGADPEANLAGGWEVPENYTTMELPEEAAQALEQAAGKLDGNELIPMALLGTQVVNGNNYAILCHSATVTKTPETSVQVVTVYEDMDGNAEISNIYTIDPGEWNQ